jgi:hypothetical protein
MYLFAKNWCKRVADVYRDSHMPPLSKMGMQSQMHDAMLPLLAEICIVNATIFPMERSMVMTGGHWAELIHTGLSNIPRIYRCIFLSKVCSTFRLTSVELDEDVSLGLMVDPSLSGMRGYKEFETELKLADTGLVASIKTLNANFNWGFGYGYCNCMGCHDTRLQMCRRDSARVVEASVMRSWAAEPSCSEGGV